MKHRRVGYLFLFLCAVSLIGSVNQGIAHGFESWYLQIGMAFVGVNTLFIMVSLFWEKGYYIQIGVCALSFVVSLFIDRASSPYSLIFLFLAVLMIYIYDIQISLFAIAGISSVFYIAAMFLVDIHHAVGMLFFSIIMILSMHTLFSSVRGCDDK